MFVETPIGYDFLSLVVVTDRPSVGPGGWFAEAMVLGDDG